MPELTDTHDLRQKIILEAKKYLQSGHEQVWADEITAKLLSEELGCSYKIAANSLRRMVKDGIAAVERRGRLNFYKLI